MTAPFGRNTFASRCLKTMLEAVLGGTFCPVVGAGASCDIGAPGWDMLVRTMGREFGDPKSTVEDLLKEKGPATALGMLCTRQAPKAVIQAMQRAIYDTLPSSWARAGEHRQSAPIELARLMILRELRTGPRSFHALTYNYDTFLEEAVASLGYRAVAITPRTRVAFAPTASGQAFGWPRAQRRGRADVEIRIVHPHGLVPRNSEEAEYDAQANELVLGDKSYAEVESRPLSESAVWQLRAFGSRCCLFYGFSFSDTAVKKLLHAADKANTRGYESLMAERALRHVALLDAREGPVDAWRRLYESPNNIVQLKSAGFLQQKRFLQVLRLEAQLSHRRQPAAPVAV